VRWLVSSVDGGSIGLRWAWTAPQPAHKAASSTIRIPAMDFKLKAADLLQRLDAILSTDESPVQQPVFGWLLELRNFIADQS
jgi:hypothetical protein